MSSERRRIHFFRYNIFSGPSVSSILFAVSLGVVSGIYIFDDLVRDAVTKGTEEQKPFQNDWREKEGVRRKC